MQLIDIDLQPVFNYKYIFNPSVIRNSDGSCLLICRLQNHPAEGYFGLCTLDEKFNPQQQLAIIRHSVLMKEDASVMLEDPRTFVHNGKIYLYHVESASLFLYFCYTVFGVLELNGSLTEQIILRYKKNGDAFTKVKELGISQEEKRLPQDDWIIEKNWQFFIRENKYYCVYQAGEKHEIFQFDFPGGQIEEKYITYGKLPWSYGRVSGGAAPVLHSDGNYYCFFHSWTAWKNPLDKHSWLQRKYHIGLYIFENKPPFRIKMMTEHPVFSGPDKDALAPSGHSVVFPGSAFFDHDTNEWCIALGWNDHSCKMLRIEHAKITENLKPVTPLSSAAIITREMKPVLQKIRRIAGRVYRKMK